MKYNIGDKVLDTYFLEYLDNYFWNKKQINKDIISVVKSANARLFSTSEKEIAQDIAGCNECLYHRQENGVPYYGHPSKRLFNLENDNDKEELFNLVKSAVEKTKAALDKKEEAEISDLEQQIQRIKAGNTSKRKALKWSVDSIKTFLPIGELND